MSLPFRQTTNLLIDENPQLRSEEKAVKNTSDLGSDYTNIDTPYGRLLINSHIAMLKKAQMLTSSSDIQTSLINTWPIEDWNFITLDETQSFAIFAHGSDWTFALLDLLKGTLIKDKDSLSPRFWIEERSSKGAFEDLFHCRKTGLKLVLLPE